ncbi:putative beta-glucosidase G [Fusarium oxysporum]|nr:putative beta-glucosidase G [Fusarium oxysporum]
MFAARMSGQGNWEKAFKKAREFVERLTVDEKTYLVTGVSGPCIGNIAPIPRLNFSGLCLQDGPASVRLADLTSVFQAGITIASSWDKNAFYERAYALGQEYRGKGAHIALAPVAGPMGRSPYAGRNWEGFGPDPYLAGIAMEKSISGLQDAGVQAVAKHFLLYEQEIHRSPVYDANNIVTSEVYSSNADDRTVHELYLWPFANAVRAGVASIMCSYNRVNGSYACQNSKLLNGLLKTELGFQGYVMADWGGVHSGVASVEAGLDMDMPGQIRYPLSLPAFDRNSGRPISFFGGNLTAAIKNGTVDEARLDDMALRVMTPYYALGQDKDFPSTDPAMVPYNQNFFPKSIWTNEWNLVGEPSRDVRGDHDELIRKLSARSTILLKNEKSALPLKNPKAINVFGNDAGDPTSGPFSRGNFEFGTLAVGGGSGNGRFSYLITPLDALKVQAKEDKTLLQYWLNNTEIAKSEMPNLWRAWGRPLPDACLVFLKTRTSENMDRDSLDVDWNGNEVVESVAKYCNNTVVIIHSGGVNNLPFAKHPNVTAIIAAHYPGMETGNSIVDILYGKVNPSGKLPYTVALNESDYNAPITTGIFTNGTDDWQVYFDEGLHTDYRYFDAHEMDVQYEFGYGLSYTTFSMSVISVKKVPGARMTAIPKKQKVEPGGNPELWNVLYSVQAIVKNSGDLKGETVAQLYVEFPDSAPEGTPKMQLRGFDKVELASGAIGKVTFELMRRDLSIWDSKLQQWVIPAGAFKLSIGFSSRDLVETVAITPVET